MAVCEKCGKPHDGTFGTGRFCSRGCANARFHSQEERDKISQSCSGLSYPSRKRREFRTCPICQESFEVVCSSRQRTCRKERCVSSLRSQIMVEKVHQGQVRSKSHRTVYTFNDQVIRCDSLMEYACLDWCVKELKATLIRRCSFSIEYLDGETIRRYVPDFEVETEDGTFIVECKSSKMGHHMSEKWGHYLRTSPLKEKALQDYCLNSSLKLIWFDGNAPEHKKAYSLVQNAYRTGP